MDAPALVALWMDTAVGRRMFTDAQAATLILEVKSYASHVRQVARAEQAIARIVGPEHLGALLTLVRAGTVSVSMNTGRLGVGRRVRLSEQAKANGLDRRNLDRLGTITWASRTRGLWLVRWDGLKTPVSYHEAFLSAVGGVLA